MPLYDLVCKNCGNTKEVFLKLDEPEPTCEKCQTKMTKAMSAPAFVLKGKNWYSDGYGLHDSKKKKGENKNA